MAEMTSGSSDSTSTAEQQWLASPTGSELLREESRHIKSALDGLFGDQFLQIGTWGGLQLCSAARTRRAALASPAAPASLVTRSERLALATDSIDVALLPHVLESHPHPHGVLREVDRVLRSDGHIVITGFNPISPWGIRHLASRRRFPRAAQRLLTEHRVRDWLTLLDYAVEPVCMFNYRAPILRSEFRTPIGGSYIIVARKQMMTLTPLRPVWKRRPRLVGGLVNPTTRNAA